MLNLRKNILHLQYIASICQPVNIFFEFMSDIFFKKVTWNPDICWVRLFACLSDISCAWMRRRSSRISMSAIISLLVLYLNIIQKNNFHVDYFLEKVNFPEYFFKSDFFDLNQAGFFIFLFSPEGLFHAFSMGKLKFKTSRLSSRAGEQSLDA